MPSLILDGRLAGACRWNGIVDADCVLGLQLSQRLQKVPPTDWVIPGRRREREVGSTDVTSD